MEIWKKIKSYFYFLNDSSNTVVKVDPYDPAVLETVEKFKRYIQVIDPKLTVHFIGSASLGIIGRKDIDLFVECQPQYFDNFIPDLNLIFGKPIRRKKEYIEWQINDAGWEIDALLIDPHCSKFRDQMLSFMLLKNNIGLRLKYEKLKRKMNGLPIRKYEKEKRNFFMQILKNYSEN